MDGINGSSYHFHRINHGAILFYSLTIGLTPLIPVPFVDDWIKTSVQRRMVRVIFNGRGLAVSDKEVDRLLEEEFWPSCLGGCAYTLIEYPIRRLLRKLVFILEIRRAYVLMSQTWYAGFLLDSALLAGFRTGGQPDEARRLRIAIADVRKRADAALIQRVLRQHTRLGALFGAAWKVFKGTAAGIPRAVFNGIRSAPGLFVRGLRGIPARIRYNFYMRIQVLLGREKAPEIVLIERIAQNIQKTLLSMPPDHFDDLHRLLMEKLRSAQALAPNAQERL
ncbi:MAG: hypothetical protein GX491_20270 [Chloroflexi bacterium]|nr:hypothetical protein [Chloroflexota bacterium]